MFGIMLAMKEITDIHKIFKELLVKLEKQDLLQKTE